MPRENSNGNGNGKGNGAVHDDPLQAELDGLALEVIKRAKKRLKTGNNEWAYVEPFDRQIAALKATAGYWGLSRRLAPAAEEEGSAWAMLTGRLAGDAVDKGDEDLGETDET